MQTHTDRQRDVVVEDCIGTESRAVAANVARGKRTGISLSGCGAREREWKTERKRGWKEKKGREKRISDRIAGTNGRKQATSKSSIYHCLRKRVIEESV